MGHTVYSSIHNMGRLHLVLGLSLLVNVAFTAYHFFPSSNVARGVSRRSSVNMGATRMPMMMRGNNRRAHLISRAETGPMVSLQDGQFVDYRWKDGTWDKSKFEKDGVVDWDAIIDAEIARRKLVIDNALPTPVGEDVTFNAAEIPWWAWVKRFHLPEAEKLNGRAAMIGYMAALGVDQLTKIGIYDQHTSLWGRLTVAATVIGIFYYREFGYDNLTDEQKMAVDEVKEQLLGFIEQGKKAAGM